MAVKKQKGKNPKEKSSPKTISSKDIKTLEADGPNQDWAQEMIAKYGEDHPWVQVNILRNYGNWIPPKQEEPKKKKKVNGIKKGKAFEREWANQIGHIFPEAKRHLEYQADEASEGADLEGTDVFKFQCKNHQNYVSVGTIFEVKKLDNGHVPVLVTKGNRLPTMAVLPATALIHLLEVYYGLEPQKTTIPKALERKKTAEKLVEILNQPCPILQDAIDVAIEKPLTVADLI